MKRIIAICVAAAGLYACADNASYNDSIRSDDPGNSGIMEQEQHQSASPAYAPSDGDLSFRGNQLMIMRNGAWVPAEADVTLDNGTVISKDGSVKKDGKEYRLRDGEVVSKTGEFFDRTGQAIESVWDGVKEGARDASEGLQRGLNDAGDRINRTVDGENN